MAQTPKMPYTKVFKAPKVPKAPKYADMINTHGKHYADLHRRFTDLGYEIEDAHKIASIVIGLKNKKGKK